MGSGFWTVSARASPYFEFGLGAANLKNAGGYFGTPASGTLGFAGNLSGYYPVTRTSGIARVDLGIQGRLSNTTSVSGNTLTFGSMNLATRLEFWRFFVGAGYSPVSFFNTNDMGILGLHRRPGGSSYFAEGGVFWRVIPEFQILFTGALEVGNSPSGASPSPITEYSIRFRFPFQPKDSGVGKKSDFDGYRYPFGIMK